MKKAKKYIYHWYLALIQGQYGFLSKKNWVYFWYFASLLLCFCAGWQIAGRSWDGELYIYLEQTDSGINSRNIASVKNGAKTVSTKGMSQNQQENIVHSAEVKTTEEVVRFSLGHPLLVGANGPALACQNYQTIDMIWTAGEVSFHGHSPKLSMQVPCQFDRDKPSLIGPFTIPKKKIISAPTHQKLFKNKNGDVLLFSHVQIRWPKKWILTQISFVHNKDDGTHHKARAKIRAPSSVFSDSLARLNTESRTKIIAPSSDSPCGHTDSVERRRTEAQPKSKVSLSAPLRTEGDPVEKVVIPFTSQKEEDYLTLNFY